MIIEIDQSGKVEETAKDTVIAFANKRGFRRSIKITAKEKRELQKFFRSIGKTRMYIYRTFAILIFLLLKGNYKYVDAIIIDREYVGQEPLLKEYILRHIRKSVPNFSAKTISFHEIGKESPAHNLANAVYRKINKADLSVTAQDIIDVILE